MRPLDALVLGARDRVMAAIRRRTEQGVLMTEQGVYTAQIGPEQLARLGAVGPWTVEDPAPIPVAIDTPIDRLATVLALSTTQVELLAVLLAVEIDPATARLAAYLCGSPAPLALTIDAMVEIVYAGRATTAAEALERFDRDLAPTGSLLRLRLVTCEGPSPRTLLGQYLRLPARVVSYLLGRPDLDAELTAYARVILPAETGAESQPDDLAIALAACRSGNRLLVLCGPPGVGRELLLRDVARALGRKLLLVRAANLRAEHVVLAFREATLQGALLTFTDADELAAPAVTAALSDSLLVHGETVALVGSDRTARSAAAIRPLTVIRLHVPAHDQRLALWRTYLGGDGGLDDAELRRIAGLYNLGIGGITRASAAARELCAFGSQRVSRDHLRAALSASFDEDLSSIAVRLDVNQRWEDLVLPDDIQQSVRHLIARVARRGDVLGRWGFARKLGSGIGLTVLLSGSPGTGKTLLAKLVARELGLDLYRIDLSRVTSKWVGETEKNLGRAFDAAEAGHVLLLFDEADTVLGKRTVDQRSANDRYANLETNYVLARLEQFQGVAFFTTNLPSAVDVALLRRMTMHIKVPFPDHEARAELWRRIIPAETPRDADLDFDRLADRYELAGGYIRNIALRAAYLAADDDAALSMGHIERAAQMEYHERGSLNIGGRLD